MGGTKDEDSSGNEEDKQSKAKMKGSTRADVIGKNRMKPKVPKLRSPKKAKTKPKKKKGLKDAVASSADKKKDPGGASKSELHHDSKTSCDTADVDLKQTKKEIEVTDGREALRTSG